MQAPKPGPKINAEPETETLPPTRALQSDPPVPTQAQTRISHHLLLCATPSKALCCPDPEQGAASWATLKRLVRELGLENPQRPQGVVWRTKADCLRVCSGGPILLIWPDGITYGGITPERIEQILRQHVIGGEPVKDWIVQRASFAGQETLNDADRMR